MLKKFSSISVLVTCLLAGLAFITFEPQPLVHAAKKDPGEESCTKKQCNDAWKRNQAICTDLLFPTRGDPMREECLATAADCRKACFNECTNPDTADAEAEGCDGSFGFTELP